MTLTCHLDIDADVLMIFGSLAYAEMRLILARIIWNFDLKLARPQEDWIAKSKSYLIWEKPPLDVYLYPKQG